MNKLSTILLLTGALALSACNNPDRFGAGGAGGAGAARAYLDAFSGAPDGPRAPAALLKLGAALGLLGQAQEACVTLGEVGTRFPTAPEAVEATTAMRSLGCQ